MRKTIIISFLFLLLLYGATLHAQYSLSGRYIDSDSIGFPAVNVALLSPDSVIIAGTTTDNNGYFHINGITAGDYILKAKMMGYDDNILNLEINRNIDLGNIILEESENLLNEVVVMSEIRRTFANRDELLLTQEIKKNSQNAADAISKIPKFTKDINGNLGTIDGQNLLIIVDGREATNDELKSLSPDDIKKLVHYTTPPTRYGRYNANSVIEVLTRQKTGRTYEVSLNTMNSVSSIQGGDMLRFVYADSINRFSAQYSINYFDFKKGNTENIYRYLADSAWQENRYISQNSRSERISHLAKADYQLTKEKFMFAAAAKYSYAPHDYTSPQSVFITDTEGEIFTGSGYRHTNNKEQQASLDLYLALKLRNNQELLFNVVNTFTQSSADNMLTRTMEGEDLSRNYSYRNVFENTSYSLIAQITYSAPLWGGALEASGIFEHKQLNQLYNTSTHNYLDYQTEKLSVSWQRQWEKLNLFAILIMNNLTFNGKTHYNFFSATPIAILNYNHNKLFSMRFQLGGATNMPQVGDLAGSTVNIDERYMSIGNSSLKPFYGFQTMLSFDIKDKNNTFFFSPSIKYWYAKDYHYSMIYENNGMFYKETLPGNNPVNLSIDAALQWTPIKYITLFGSVFACYNEFYTASNGKTTGWWGSQTLGARINVWEMQAEFMCFDPFSNYLTKYCEGDISYRGTPGYRAALEWTHKSFKIGVNWLRQNRTTIVGSIPNMRLSETNYWKEQNNTVMIVFDYRFRYGDSKQRNIQKKLNNADTDTGLTEDMKAK